MPDYLATFRTRLLHAEALVELARGQQRLADAGDYDGLIDSLGRKQRIIERMAAGCDDLTRREWVADRDFIESPLREECDALLERAERCLDETLTLERDTITQVTAARDRVTADLNRLTATRQTGTGYAEQDTSPQRSLLDLSR